MQINPEHARFIELIAQWEGKVNSTSIQSQFDVSRQTATKILQDYCKLHPESLVYNASTKGFEPTTVFQTHHCQGSIEEYNQLLTQSELNAYLIETPFHLIEAPLRNINPAIVRPIIQAIRQQVRLDIGYASVSTPDYEERIIAPHSLAFNGIRWHVRAYCEKNNDYRDFVLSRFNGIFNDEGPTSHTKEHDQKWNTWVDVVIEPDPRLSDAQKRIIELDYQMENGQSTLTTRAALLMYLLQKLHLEQYKPTAEAQQIIVNSECWKKIEQYLPK